MTRPDTVADSIAEIGYRRTYEIIADKPDEGGEPPAATEPPYVNDNRCVFMIEYETAEFWQTQIEVFANETAALAWKENPPPGVTIIGDIWQL